MIASELAATGAPEMSWFQARWSAQRGRVGGDVGAGPGKTPHLPPSDGYGPSLANRAGPASAPRPQSRAAIATPLVHRATSTA